MKENNWNKGRSSRIKKSASRTKTKENQRKERGDVKKKQEKRRKKKKERWYEEEGTG